MKKILIVAGARPNFMKIAPIMRLLKNSHSIDASIVHTGQHYDYKMSEVFFTDLEIPKPKYNLDVGSDSHAKQTAKIMVKFEEVCEKFKPDYVILVGDVNSTLACAITAKKMNIKVIHIEAGLRSYDRFMPEEINRLVTDSITDYYFITEQDAFDNLMKEGVKEDRIFYVGNLMIDSLYFALKKIKKRAMFNNNEYGLVTLHRPSNVDNINVLKEILETLDIISKDIKLYFSIHPRTKKNIEENKLVISENITILESLSYFDFIHIMRDSKVVFTDSGGIQEETSVLKIPCYTLRENTERPITLKTGTNHLVGTQKVNILEVFKEKKYSITHKYNVPDKWDGKTSYRILEILENL